MPHTLWWVSQDQTERQGVGQTTVLGNTSAGGGPRAARTNPRATRSPAGYSFLPVSGQDELAPKPAGLPRIPVCSHSDDSLLLLFG